ncbi:MAG: DnaB-like helicase C-terminal domain-containing protein [Pseudomonadota bacterium]
MNSSPPFAPPVNELYSIDAEQALLGAILYDNEVYFAVADTLKAEHFYDPFHGRIYAYCGKLIVAGHLASPVVLHTKLKDDDAFVEAGGERYLIQLAQSVQTTVGAGDYGRLITDYWTRRQIVEVGREMIEAACAADVEDDPQRQIEQAAQALADLAERREPRVSFSDQVETYLVNLQDKLTGKAPKGLKSGMPEWDERLGGFMPSELTVFAGRPSMGKSIVACKVAISIARQGRGVFFYSAEMSFEQVIARLTAALAWSKLGASIPYSDQRKGTINRQQFESLLRVCEDEVRHLPIIINDKSGLTAEALTIEAMRARRTFDKMGHPLGCVLIDYLQRMGTAKPSGNEVVDTGRKAVALKNLSKDLNVAVCAMAQLSRQVETRDDKRPQLSDLRQSGEIEQEADVVTMLYREEYYLSRMEPREGTPEHLQWQGAVDEVRGVLELITCKGRAARIGTDRVSIDLAHAEISRGQAAA